VFRIGVMHRLGIVPQRLLREPLRVNGGLSACGSATVVPLRLRSRRLSASASLSRSPNRRPKPRAKGIWDEVESKRRHRVGECNARWQKPGGRA
jgi:hypothetical protein